ncbi:MAG: GTPase [Planctomycetes bacterium]|nr:GTPase [Planctomycetota bacterium]
MNRRKVVIMGAAGRDFHNFNCVFRDSEAYEVVAFTATQIPGIESRRYPAVLAGSLYPDGIAIHPESDLERIIAEEDVDEVVFSLSDVSSEQVMAAAARTNAAGADFRLLGARATELVSSRPVVSVCAVRTGCGKSPASRRVTAILKDMGLKTVAVRHPMPYGNLKDQAVQRFETIADLERHDCTIEEMEEYEPHLRGGSVVFAGCDYEAILREAEREADVILWDGGNNDTPFFRSDFHLVLVDPHRPGHELSYYPGQTNFRSADCLVIAKIDTASRAGIEAIWQSIRAVRPDVPVVEAAIPITVEGEGEGLRGKRVLVVEDGPTLTHGGMKFGAGVIAARKFGAAELVDPRPYLVGSLRDTFAAYPGIESLLPAMGYGAGQIEDLEATIRNTPCDAVVIGTPIDLRRVVTIDQPALRVRYELQEIGRPDLADVLRSFWEARR